MGDTFNFSGDFRTTNLNIGNEAGSTLNFGRNAFENQLRPHIGNQILVNRPLETSATIEYETETTEVAHTVDADKLLETITFTGKTPLDNHLRRIGQIYLEKAQQAKAKKV